MPILRFCLGAMSLGATLCLAWTASWCWSAWGIGRALGGGDKAKLLGITLPYPIWLMLLGAGTLSFAFGAMYAVLFPAHSDN